MNDNTGDPEFPEFVSFFQGSWADRRFSEDEPLDEFLARLESGVEAGPLEVGPYRCLRELGRGGQGVVYLAKDPRLEREVALKILRCSPLDAHKLLARFQQEARVASRLDHPGICHVFDAGVAGDVPYIAMRYIEGRSLAALLKGARSDAATDLDDAGSEASILEFDTVQPEAAEAAQDQPIRSSESPAAPRSSSRDEITKMARLIEQTAAAVHAAHEAGVVHRDIKPGNIMITPEGVPVILDFGLAHDARSERASLTQSGEFFGTPPYMAPEQVTEHAADVDRRTDVWALGATLYECLTGRLPFPGATQQSITHAILTKEPESLRSIAPAIPRDLEIVVLAALDKDIRQRYATAADLAEDLRRVRQNEPILARRAGLVRRTERWMVRNPTLAASLLALVVAVSAVVVLAFVNLSQARRALEETTRERDRADDAASQARAALNRTERMLDVQKLAQLKEAASEQLWPAVPEKVPGMEAWTRRARELVSHLPEQRERLAAMRAQALPYSDEDRAKDEERMAIKRADLSKIDGFRATFRKTLQQLEAKTELSTSEAKRKEVIKETIKVLDSNHRRLSREVEQRLTWRMADPESQGPHDELAAFCDELDSFATDADPMADSIKSVQARLEFARALEATTIEQHREAWQRTRKRIATNSHYGGMQMTPQLGLIPLGPDPDSSLEEFAHTASGAVPERQPDTGQLKLRGGDPGGTGVVLVLIPGGSFRAGAQKTDPSAPNYYPRAGIEDAPVQEITLEPFFISKYEFTQNQWRVLTKSDPSFYRAGKRIIGKFVNVLHPVEQVSWTECDRLATRLGLALPTDAQWEYCCRAGTATPWYTGSEKRSLRGHANVADADGARAHPAGWHHEADWNDGYAAHAPIGSYDANPWGLHDMHGNIWEWVRDPWENPPTTPRSGDGYRAHTPAAPRAYRGGSFEEVAELARSSTRAMLGPDMKSGILGFRPARPVDP